MLPLGRPRSFRTPFLRRARIRSGAVVILVTRIRTPWLTVLPLALVRLTIEGAIRLTVSRCRTDFEFVQLVPLFIGAIPLGDGKQFANPATRINNLWIIHNRIMNHSA